MRKYIVPIVALMGFALLTPKSDAANLIIKSRATSVGAKAILPVAVTNVGGTGQLWGLDFGLTFDTTKIGIGTDPGGNGSAFSPQAVASSTEVPVVVSGTTFVGTGATNPNLYVGIVRGTSAFNTATSAAGAPNNASIGLIQLTCIAGAQGDVVQLVVPTGYNVANTGDGSLTNNRAGASGATSDITAGAAVSAEAVTLNANYPVSGTAIPVPMGAIGIGKGPGDVTGQGVVVGAVSKLAAVLSGKGTLTPYQKIAGDVAPNALGYVPHTAYAGTYGLSYGDGSITVGDVSLLAKKVAGSATNFPVNE